MIWELIQKSIDFSKWDPLKSIETLSKALDFQWIKEIKINNEEKNNLRIFLIKFNIWNKIYISEIFKFDWDINSTIFEGLKNYSKIIWTYAFLKTKVI